MGNPNMPEAVFKQTKTVVFLDHLPIWWYMLVRCMTSSLVRTGFVRGSTTQGNGCYQHRCTNNTLEVKQLFILHNLPVVFHASK